MGQDIYRKSRILYILEAAFEYFISIMVGGAYIAKVTQELGMSDSLTGILSSLTTLGFSFQILAIFLTPRRSVKKFASILHTINQLCFTLIYLVPFFEVPHVLRTAIFIVLLLGGHILNNIVNPPKTNWFMSLVDDHQRGRFTANKEIVSLLGGMVFTFLMGGIIDHFEAIGEIRTSFILCGITLFALTVLHSCTLLFSREKPQEETKPVRTRELLRDLLHDKKLLKVILVSVLWHIATYASTPFYGTYTIKELGFSMTFISILSAIYAVCRSLVSRPLGRYADRTSFSSMLNICLVFAFLGFSVNIFTVPSNGKIFYTVYYILYALCMAGMNSGELNLIYDHVSHEKRVCALALKNTVAGLVGFLTTLIVSRLVEAIQANGNRFLGMQVYAQQVTSAIAAIMTVVVFVYLNLVVRKMKKTNGN